MITKCKFNPDSDVEEVVPGLAIDVAEMMATGVVPSAENDAALYSKITDIKEVGHYLKDKIQTFMAAVRIGDSIASQAAGEVKKDV